MSTKSQPVCEAVAARERVAVDVKRIVAEVSGVALDVIQEDQTLFGDLAWDSLDLVECAMEIEEHFDLSVPDEMTDEVKMVGDVIEGVLTLLAKQTD
jgi:acyl carrier protein